jgi:hypothetical protein
MKGNMLIRQIHRWTSIVFAVVVAAIFAMQGLGIAFAQFVYFLPLPPLFILLATGLWMFALPYLAKSRRAVS